MTIVTTHTHGCPSCILRYQQIVRFSFKYIFRASFMDIYKRNTENSLLPLLFYHLKEKRSAPIVKPWKYVLGLTFRKAFSLWTICTKEAYVRVSYYSCESSSDYKNIGPTERMNIDKNHTHEYPQEKYIMLEAFSLWIICERKHLVKETHVRGGFHERPGREHILDTLLRRDLCTISRIFI